MSDILAEICDRKRSDVAALQKSLPLAEMRAQAEVMAKSTTGAVRPFATALRQAGKADNLALIGEIKKASPSRGLIRADFDVATLAQAYRDGGATCLSVLTDAPYFQGDYGYLAEARAAVDLPILQKDFMLEAWQIYHARTIGADCILLILAALEDSRAAELESLALELGLHVLLEVHSAEELQRAMRLRSPLVGVNNRNLKTLEIDLSIAETLLPQIRTPDKIAPKIAPKIAIAESGLYSHDDLLRMQNYGAQAFLIGESLMRQADLTKAVQAILGGSI